MKNYFHLIWGIAFSLLIINSTFARCGDEQNTGVSETQCGEEPGCAGCSDDADEECEDDAEADWETNCDTICDAQDSGVTGKKCVKKDATLNASSTCITNTDDDPPTYKYECKVTKKCKCKPAWRQSPAASTTDFDNITPL